MVITRLRVVVLGFVALLASTAAGQQLIATVPVGVDPFSIAVNSVTHKTYVANNDDGTVTVIDPFSFAATTVPTEGGATYLAVNQVTNMVYVTGFWGMTVIDGATNNTTFISIQTPEAVAVDSVTNKIYAIFVGGVDVIDGATLNITYVPVGASPFGIAINEQTNKIYVSNQQGSSVTVIDGATDSTTTIAVPGNPAQIAVDAYRNKIYVLCYLKITVIDGTTLSQNTVDIPQSWNVSFALDALSNKIYVAVNQDQYDNYVLIIDGATLGTQTIELGLEEPQSIAVEPVSNRIYVTYVNTGNSSGLLVLNGATGSVKTVFTVQQNPSVIAVDSAIDRIYIAGPYARVAYVVADGYAEKFVPLTPCRVVDTRLANGPLGGPPIQGGTERDFPLPQGTCNIPANTAAYSLNVTVVPQGQLHYLTVWPTGEAQPPVSTMNSDGRTKANAAIVAAGGQGAVSVYASDTTNVILDINGYFEVPTSSNDLVFYPMTPCRIVDTRGPNGPFGGPYLTGNQERDFPILSSNCNIPSSAQAYSLNVTALPHGHLGYLTVWPDGQSQPVVSTLNAPTGTYVANAALVQAGSDGGIAVYPSNDTDLLVDINGYFAPPGPGGMSLYTVLPCRAVDTRQNRGRFEGTVVLDIVDSSCGLQNAEAYVFNATVIPQGSLGYLTLWPTTEMQPGTSTLNALDGAITSNMAIVTNIDGWVNAHASNWTQLLLDASAYFAP